MIDQICWRAAAVAVAGLRPACGGRGLASSFMRTISSGMLDIKDDVCKTDELDGRVDGVRAREQQRSERGCMHGGKT